MQAKLFLPNFVLNFTKGSFSSALKNTETSWTEIKDTPNAYCQNSNNFYLPYFKNGYQIIQIKLG